MITFYYQCIYINIKILFLFASVKRYMFLNVQKIDAKIIFQSFFGYLSDIYVAISININDILI